MADDLSTLDTDTDDLPGIYVRSLTFSDGVTLELGANDVVVIVGPNNAGKSAALRAIRDKMTSRNHPSVVVQQIQIARTGNPDIAGFLSRFAISRGMPPDNPVYEGQGVSIPRNHAVYLWNRNDGVLDAMSR